MDVGINYVICRFLWLMLPSIIFFLFSFLIHGRVRVFYLF